MKYAWRIKVGYTPDGEQATPEQAREHRPPTVVLVGENLAEVIDKVLDTADLADATHIHISRIAPMA